MHTAVDPRGPLWRFYVLSIDADERLALIHHKIDRAKKHIAEPRAKANLFGGANPFEVDTKRNPQTGQLIYYLSKVNSVPPSIPLIVGDAIQNLRDVPARMACLDCK
jgi:hypothetical protein